MKKRTKTLLLCIAIAVVTVASGFGIWYLIQSKAPAGNGNVLNVAWYHENGTEFTISTADQLFELAALSEYYDFEGQTIKVDADIIVNEGDAADWEKAMPDRRWEPITGFAGTFDGQGHTISGLYGLGHFYGIDGIQTVYYTTGMFADTQDDCVIKNFKLVNSFFSSDLSEGVGSIASYGGGTFENIYSDAIILSYKENNGGIVGRLTQKSNIINCWYDGEIRIEGNVGRFTGGIVGRVCASNGQNKIEHCLNTADISSTVKNRGMNTGGLIGNIQSQARIHITDCLTVGDINVEYEAAVGSFVGNIESSSAVIIKNTYVKAESFHEVIYNANGSMKGSAVVQNESTLTGYNAYKWTDLDFENYWAVVEEGTPILKSFAKEVPSLDGIEKGYDISWYKASESEYLIKNAKQLYGLAILSYSNDFIGKSIYLANDIVLNEGDAENWEKKAPKNKWIPIGTYGYPFEGTLDGQGYSISGLYMNTAGGYGLFGETGSSSMISNLKLENSYLYSFGQVVGGVVGRSAGVIQNVYSDAIVVGEKGNVGGLVGQVVKNKGLKMSNCWFDGKATNLGNTSSTKKIGGLIGVVRSESAIENCLNTGTIDASCFNYNQGKDPKDPIVVPIVGGLVGYVESKVPFAITDCLNAGPVLHHKDATAAYASVVGYIDGDVTAYNVYATEESCDNHPLKQSVSGQVCPIPTETLKGYKGYQWTLLDFEKYWAVNKKGTPVLKMFAEEVPSLSGVKREVDVSWYSADKKTFTIDSRQDLFGFRLMSYNTDFAGKTVKVGKNITVNTGNAASWAKKAPQYQWTPIGTTKYSFKGTFDGGMHSISGIYMKADTEYSGFFGVLTEGTAVKNLKILNSYYESSADYMGSVVGSGNANLSNIYSNAILVSSANSAGGLVGRSTKNITITNCWFDGKSTITGTGMPNRRAGGIVACIYSGKVTLSHCLNTGTISAPNYKGTNSATSTAVVPLVGGLAGQVAKEATVTISDSLNAGEIICHSAATTGYSAIVGYSNGKVTLSDTYATKESCEYQIRGEHTGYVATYGENDISGYLGYQWLNLDFNKYWAVVVNPTSSTPVLKSFASSTPSLAGISKLMDTSWYNEAAKEFILYDAADLNGFAYLSNTKDFAGKTVYLGADIEVNADINNPIYKWDPIGNYDTPFAGTFDGQMYTISGIYAKTDLKQNTDKDLDKEPTGLFARTDKRAVVKNFILKDSYFESNAMNLGSIVGHGAGTFDTIKSEAVVVGHEARVGGFIGVNRTSGTSLTNCWFAGTVTSKENGAGLRGTGGLVGVSYTDSSLFIENCLNSGTVDASAYAYKEANGNVTVLAGGLVGWFRSGGVLTIKNSLNVGKVLVNAEANNAYGSLIGYTDGTTGISGTYTTEESSPYQKNGDKTGIKVVKESDLIGTKGYQWNKIDMDFVNVWTLVADGTPELRSFAEVLINIATVEKLIDMSWYDGVPGSTYTLYDKADLYGLAELSKEHDFAGMTIKLGKDIVVNEGNAAGWATTAPELAWTPIGSKECPFEGTFDGLNEETGEIYEVKGIYLKTNSRGAGFFGATGKEAVIQNVALTNSYLESTITGNTQSEFGGLVGYAAGKFDTIYSDAIVVGNGVIAGGLFGYTYYETTINECWFDGTLTNTRHTDTRTGAIVGQVKAKTEMSNCLNTGAVSAPNASTNDACLGGLVGYVSSALTMKKSMNVGRVNKGNAIDVYGSILGGVGSSGSAKVSTTYTTSESCDKQTCGTIDGAVIVYSESEIFGEEGYAWERLDLDFKKTWTLVKESAPVLTAFADKAPNSTIDLSKVEKQIDTSWYVGHENDTTYVLNSKGALYGFAALSQSNKFEGKTIKLGADIVVNEGNVADWATKAPADTWTPIGEFAGTFDGDMHTISGLYVNSTNTNVGLFSKTTATAKVKELKLVNSYFKSQVSTAASYIGSIVGSALGEFDTIYSSAIVETNKQRVGGLVGYVSSDSSSTTKFKMTNCWFDGSVTSTRADDIRIAGLIGQSQAKAELTNCLNTGTVNAPSANTADPEIAGLVGCVSSAMTMNNCVNVGALNIGSGSKNHGGIVGYNSNKVTGANNYYAEGNVQAGPNITDAIATKLAIAKMTGDTAKDNMNLDFTNTWATVSGNAPVLKVFEAMVMDTSWYVGHESDSTYVLKDKGDLLGFAKLSQTNNFAGKTVKLGADIVVNYGNAADWATVAPAHNWTPIGEFAGTFDGDMHTISGLYVNSTNTNVGLFSKTTAAAKVKELKLVNSYFKNQVSTAASYIGSIVGSALGEFDTIYSGAIVETNKQRVGGLVGYVSSDSSTTTKFKMTNCWFAGSVTSTRADDIRIGGLIGQSQATSEIKNCLSTGTVNAPSANTADPEIAGLVGCVSSTLKLNNCVSAGTLNIGSGSKNYGGIVGYNSNKVTGANNYYIESNGQAGPNITTSIATSLTNAQMSGDAAKDNMSLDFENVWKTVTGSTPVLKSFSK